MKCKRRLSDAEYWMTQPLDKVLIFLKKYFKVNKTSDIMDELKKSHLNDTKLTVCCGAESKLLYFEVVRCSKCSKELSVEFDSMELVVTDSQQVLIKEEVRPEMEEIKL